MREGAILLGPRAEKEGGMRLSAFMRQRREEILSSWERELRRRVHTSVTGRPLLREYVAALLDQIARKADGPSAGRPGSLAQGPVRSHALELLERGFGVEEVASEYALMRRILLRLIARDQVRLEDGELELVNGAIDEAIVSAAAAHVYARQRTLQAVDRIAEAALAGGTEVEQFLPRLIGIVMETTPAVDSVVIALLDGNELRVRAAAGLEPRLVDSCSYQLGEGVLGTAAATRRPVMLRSAATDPMVRCEGVRTSGTGALYAVPLVHGDELIGAAQMGSRAAADFSEDDKLLFRAMATRAALLLVQAQFIAREQAARADAEASKEELQRVAMFREQFMGMVGHDLRNPLSVVTTSMQLLLQRGGATQAQADIYRRVFANAERMSRMVGDLLDFTRGRLGGGIPVQPVPTDIHDLSERLIDELRVTHPKRVLIFSRHGDGHGIWDADRMRQLLSNLIGNALQYSPTDAPVRVSVRGERSSVVIAVNNKGRTIPPDELAHLFEPFRRARTNERPREGLGLGLYIVMEIARAHGGTVEATSTEDTGTSFVVRVPRSVPPVAPA